MFKHVPETAKLKLALLPESLTLSYRQTYDGQTFHPNPQGYQDLLPIWQLAAYWTETKQGNPLVVFGVVHIFYTKGYISPTFDKFFPKRSHASITYDELLANTTQEHVAKASYAKLGNGQPLFRGDRYKSDFHLDGGIELAGYYDAQHLQDFQNHPNDLPPRSDGWYKISPKEK